MTNIDPQTIRAIVYRTLATEGRAPSPREIAREAGCTPDKAGAALRELAERHAVVLTPDGDAVRMAHPFSAASMGFVVTPADAHDDRRWWGGCAWDSFGISAALVLDVLIDTGCPGCGTQLRVACGPHQPPPAELAVRVPKPAAQWWDDVVATCTAIRLFCTADHAHRWQERSSMHDGQIVSATALWELATPWYSDRLRDDYTPHTTTHNQQLLAAVGLTGDFWQLP